MIILHSYLQNPGKEEILRIEESETWQALESIRVNYTVVDRRTDSETNADYDRYEIERFIARYWNQGEDLCLLEHDIVPTLSMIDALAICTAPACEQLTTAPGQPEQKPFFCFGFCKISLQAQRMCPLPWCHFPGDSWEDFEPRFWQTLEAVVQWPNGTRNTHKHTREVAKHNGIPLDQLSRFQK